MQIKLRRSIGVDAEVAAQELAEHYKRHGKITPRQLVDESEPEGSPLHDAFEWDDGKAGDQWRLQQARSIIRAVHVVTEDGEDHGAVYVNVQHEGEQAYHAVVDVVRDPDMFAAASGALVRKLQEMRKAIEDLSRHAGRSRKRKRATGRAGEHIDAARSALEEVSP